jgi:hypothetical protein
MDNVKIVSVDDSPMALSENSTTTQKARPKSKAATYLIDNGHFTKEELAAVTPFIEKSEIVFLAWANSDHQMMYWLPTGERITRPPVAIPKELEIRPGQTLAYIRQSVMPPDYWHDENGTVVLAVEVSTTVSPKYKEAWAIVQNSPDAFVDIPFTLAWQESSLAKLSLKKGESANLSGVHLTIAGIVPATKDIHTTNSVHVSVVGSLYPRRFQLIPAFEGKESSENPTLKSWTLIDGSDNQLDQSKLEMTVCSDAKFSDWHAIIVSRKTTFSGFFGHVARRPIETNR